MVRKFGRFLAHRTIWYSLCSVIWSIELNLCLSQLVNLSTQHSIGEALLSSYIVSKARICYQMLKKTVKTYMRLNYSLIYWACPSFYLHNAWYDRLRKASAVSTDGRVYLHILRSLRCYRRGTEASSLEVIRSSIIRASASSRSVLSYSCEVKEWDIRFTQTVLYIRYCLYSW